MIDKKVFPKLKDFIPIYGNFTYINKCEKEENKCFNLDGKRVSNSPINYDVCIMTYHLLWVLLLVVL